MSVKAAAAPSGVSKSCGLLREFDKSEALRRRGRIVRNLFKEPPPRSKELIFESFTYEHPTVHYVSVMQGRRYHSGIDLKDLDEVGLALIDEDRRSRLFVLAGLSIAPHHFLMADFGKVRVECRKLTDDAVAFYEEHLQNGLAEFRYRQGLNPNRRIRIIAERCEPLMPKLSTPTGRALLLNGGGKGTCVMVEFLKRSALELTWLSIGAGSHQQDIEKVSMLEARMKVDVIIDPKVVADRVYPWGHMPTSGVLLSVSMIPAISAGYSFIVTGNERSANEGNLIFRRMEINHPYTNSHAFVSRFNEVVGAWIGVNVLCFSAFRMFYDIQIAELIDALCSGYVGKFVSCNKGRGWCNDSEKRAFVYLALSPFMSRGRLNLIFGDDLWMSPRTRAFVLHLMTGRVKRWECVGTREECNLAASLYFQRYGRREFGEWPFMSNISESYQGMDVENAQRSLLRSLNRDHNIPGEISASIEKVYFDVAGSGDHGAPR